MKIFADLNLATIVRSILVITIQLIEASTLLLRRSGPVLLSKKLA